MHITKLEHACLVIAVDDQQLVIDPGVFVTGIETHLKNVVGVVITHKHSDHFDHANVARILTAYPEAKIFAPEDVADELTDTADTRVVYATEGAQQNAGTFTLDFYGHDHAVVYQTVPCKNVGVLVNGELYYPGDSFTLPTKKPQVVAVPAGGPWMKISEAMDFVAALRPKFIFSTHNGMYNDFGLGLSKSQLTQAVEAVGGQYKDLGVGDSFERAES